MITVRRSFSAATLLFFAALAACTSEGGGTAGFLSRWIETSVPSPS